MNRPPITNNNTNNTKKKQHIKIKPPEKHLKEKLGKKTTNIIKRTTTIKEPLMVEAKATKRKNPTKTTSFIMESVKRFNSLLLLYLLRINVLVFGVKLSIKH